MTANPQSPPVLAANGENAADGLRVNCSAGGASSGTGTTAGAGSSMTLYAGAGGTSSGGTNVTGGAAGSFAFRGATGGAGTGTGNGGAGSDFGVYLGAGSSGAAAGRNGKFFVAAQPTPTANVFSVEDSSQIDKVYVDSGFNLNAAANVVLKSAGSHLNASAGSNDFDGVISVSAATSASHTFSTAYASTPVCVLTPTSNPGSLTWWVTASTTAVTANLSAAGTITFNYHCAGNPN